MALRIALLGCGPLGLRYADMVTAQGSTVSVIFGRNGDVAADMVRRTGARHAPSLRDAVTAVGVDAVVVCLDGDERAAAIDAAADAGRPTFDAMPLTAAAMAALERARDAGVVVGVDLRHRHEVGVCEVADAVRDGQIGDVSSCSIIDRDESVGFETSLIHDLDLAHHLTRSHIETVAGVRNSGTAMLVVTHANGAVTSVENSQNAPAGSELRVEIGGSLGTASNGPARHGARIARADGLRRPQRGGDAPERSLTAQWASFDDAVLTGVNTDIVTEAGAALVAARAVQLALVESRTVHVAELLSAP